MTQNNGLLSNFIPKIGTTSLSLTPYCVVKCFFKKNKVHPWPPVTRPKTPPTPHISLIVSSKGAIWGDDSEDLRFIVLHGELR